MEYQLHSYLALYLQLEFRNLTFLLTGFRIDFLKFLNHLLILDNFAELLVSSVFAFQLHFFALREDSFQGFCYLVMDLSQYSLN